MIRRPGRLTRESVLRRAGADVQLERRVVERPGRHAKALSLAPEPIPDEEQRLEAVRRYEILDTPVDGSFDRVTRLAASLLDMPIAIVSIVDHDRIWFKSRYGVDVDQIERDPGLCASAIMQDAPWVIEDARRDPRALANPLVAGEFGLQFYAGAPLRTYDGHNLGTICVLDREPRQFAESQRRTLTDLAAIVMDELELRLAARRLVAATEERTQLIAARQRQAKDLSADLFHRMAVAQMSLQFDTGADPSNEIALALDAGGRILREMALQYASLLLVIFPLPDWTDWLAEMITAAARSVFGPTADIRLSVSAPGVTLVELSAWSSQSTSIGDPGATLAFETAVAAGLAASDLGPHGVAITSMGRASNDTERMTEVMQTHVLDLHARAARGAVAQASRRDIEEILEAGLIRTEFQPIVDATTGVVFALEALSRGPEGHDLERPEALLEAAERVGLGEQVEREMERLASHRAQQRFASSMMLLFVNLSANRLAPESSGKPWDSALRWPMDRTVVEVTERTPLSGERFLRDKDALRSTGVRFALDDAGSGYAGLEALAVLSPDFVKVDMHLVRGSDADPVRQAIIQALVQFVRRTGAHLIAEGVETVTELGTLQRLGVDLVQGFLIAPPAELPAIVDAAAIQAALALWQVATPASPEGAPPPR